MSRFFLFITYLALAESRMGAHFDYFLGCYENLLLFNESPSYYNSLRSTVSNSSWPIPIKLNHLQLWGFSSSPLNTLLILDVLFMSYWRQILLSKRNSHGLSERIISAVRGNPSWGCSRICHLFSKQSYELLSSDMLTWLVGHTSGF